MTLETGVVWLAESPQILHRDISVNNVMYRRKGSKIYGVLNDFDLAAPVTIVAPPHFERTGTLPFMAMDLLEQHSTLCPTDVHLLRHDLESIFWVLAWICSRYPHKQRIKKTLSDWAICAKGELAQKKRQYLRNEAPLTAAFKFLQPWMNVLASWVVDMRIAMDTELRDKLKLGKHIGHSTMSSEIVREWLTHIYSRF